MCIRGGYACVADIERARKPLQHARGGTAILRADASQRRLDGRFDGLCSDGIGSDAACRQAKHGAPAIARIVDTVQQTLRDESVQHTRQRARVDVQNRGEIAGGEAGEEAHDTQHEALRAGDADLAGHVFGCALERMYHCPEQSHELQDIRQCGRHVDEGRGRW
jgi:hypothetical protein